jgi:hypothetical protein
MAAWREVARRIAHEVKNPLTPIKLSAQRLIRRYGEEMGPEETVFSGMHHHHRAPGGGTAAAGQRVLHLCPPALGPPGSGRSQAICRGGFVLVPGSARGYRVSIWNARARYRSLTWTASRCPGADKPWTTRWPRWRPLSARQVALRLSYDDILKIVRLGGGGHGAPACRPNTACVCSSPISPPKRAAPAWGWHREHHCGRS